jgi:hypothetical protein
MIGNITNTTVLTFTQRNLKFKNQIWQQEQKPWIGT